ncbi:LysR family transcriptional regulator [Acinetobacter qingfengensis]|uniref:HTH lysR-type domain-containing protein n=1 Tax=Acinetobacter qingfengensis TaxID=1262585 RepID=A0A1E7R1A2_9GAMM|nr:LysR family transcriptional regulator [Acinetobacter qingfengensis]KAA8733275.1 LysR family transcriptional regulator [Acinetobacter qingfengensis]OEY93093.1 hypothetical protein BJI46_04965 [Acinetobacter qingfengensis]
MKKLPDMQHIQVFIHVAKYKSFIQTAKLLNLSASSITNTINTLENNLSTRLFNRSTRSVALTQEGHILFAAMAPIYDDYFQALDQLNFQQQHPQGRIKISLPLVAQELFFEKIFVPFQHAHPNIELELNASDALVNIIEEGFDFGIRYNEQIPQDMIAIPFGNATRLIAVASPEFLQQHGLPQHIDDLDNFDCINRQFPSGLKYAWEFMQQQQKINKKVSGKLTLNSDRMIIKAALNHLGIAYVYEDLIRQELEQQILIPLLDAYQYPKSYFYLYYSNKHYMSATSQVFIQWIKNHFYPDEWPKINAETGGD